MTILLLGENGSVHIQKWIRALADRAEITMHVITYERGVMYDDVHYHFLKPITNTKLDYVLNASRVRSIIRAVNPDLVHAHYATSYGFMAAQSNFHPLIITGWGADIFDSPKQWIMRQMLQYSFRKADGLSVLSRITREEMKKYTDKDVRLIPFGVATEKFNACDRTNRTIVRVGTVRTLTEKYGIEYLIRAFAILRQKLNHIHLDIVGDGPQRGFLEALAVELNVADFITFHGYVNQNSDFEKYKSLLDSFDIFTILSIIDSETFGVASVEASACGLPVVATKVGGLPEVVSDQHTGILVPPKDSIATAEALEKLIVDKELRHRMGRDGREYVLANYDWKKNVDQMIEFYRSQISKHA